MSTLRESSMPSSKTSRTRNASRGAKIIVAKGEVPFKDVLADRYNGTDMSLDQFSAFCEERDAAESLRFFLSTESMLSVSAATQPQQLQQPHHKPPSLQDWANWLETYIKEDAIDQVNISHAQRRALEHSFADWQAAVEKEGGSSAAAVTAERTFLQAVGKARSEVLSLLEMGLYPQFVNRVRTQRQLALSRELALWWRARKLPSCREFFTFPSPVNEAESRLNNFVSGVFFPVLALALDYHAGFPWLYLYIVYGYVARVLCGPRLEPSAMFVLFALRPLVVEKCGLLEDKFVAGPPKRFAQLLGGCFALTGTLVRFIAVDSLEERNAAFWAMIAAWACLVFAASLAAFVDFCLGCWIFQLFMNAGCCPPEVCEECHRQFATLRRAPVASRPSFASPVLSTAYISLASPLASAVAAAPMPNSATAPAQQASTSTPVQTAAVTLDSSTAGSVPRLSLDSSEAQQQRTQQQLQQQQPSGRGSRKDSAASARLFSPRVAFVAPAPPPRSSSASRGPASFPQPP